MNHRKQPDFNQAEAEIRHPTDITGWLEDDDPFFDEIDAIVAARGRHLPGIRGTEEEDPAEA